jgi:tetratricopeptide (TPR) repeat protein
MPLWASLLLGSAAPFQAQAAQAAQAAEALLPLQMALEEGAWREEVLGHYNSAIRIHEQLLEHPALPDRIRVEAMHRLGVCYSMKGNLPPAVNLFLRLVREFPDAEPFSQKASHNLLVLSPEAHPADRSWFLDERLFLGDLVLVLDAALTHSETQVVDEVIGDALGALRMLRGQLSGDDLQSVDRTIPALEALEGSLVGPRAPVARAGWARSAGRAWMLDRAPLCAPDDANAAILECRDRLARALIVQDAAEIRRQAGRAARWADPVLRVGHESLTEGYLGLVRESMAVVAARASEGRFREARSVWLQSARTLNRAFGAFTLHVPGLAEFPEELRPELVAVLTRVEESLRAIESPDKGQDPQVPLSQALERVREIESRWLPDSAPSTPGASGDGPSRPSVRALSAQGRGRLRRWAEDWEAVRVTLRAGDLQRARQLLKPYEL